MLISVARLAAILFWMPAIGISVSGGIMLSPYEVMLAILQPVIWATAFDPKRILFPAIALGISTLSLVFSINFTGSLVYYSFFVLFTIPNMLLLVDIFEDREATQAFVVTFIRTGIWMAPLAIVQFLSPVAIQTINNTNYALSSGRHRAWLFTPEGSILAALYIVAIAMTLFSMCKAAQGIPRRPLDMAFLFAGLVCTDSSSTLTLLPLILIYVLVLSRAKLKTFLIAGALAGVGAAFFYIFLYGYRIESGSTVSSVGIRFATDIVGAILVTQHWVAGLGPGMNKGAGDDVMEFFYQLTGHVGETKEGFDNFTLAQMVELGVMPGILSIATVVSSMKWLWQRRGCCAEPLDFVAIFGVSIWGIGFMIGGYRGIPFEWLYYPAGFVVFMRMRQAPVRSSGLAVGLV